MPHWVHSCISWLGTYGGEVVGFKVRDGKRFLEVVGEVGCFVECYDLGFVDQCEVGLFRVLVEQGEGRADQRTVADHFVLSGAYVGKQSDAYGIVQIDLLGKTTGQNKPVDIVTVFPNSASNDFSPP
jgi:hypothetical protein